MVRNLLINQFVATLSIILIHIKQIALPFSMSVLAEFDNFQCFLVGPEDKTQLNFFIGPAFALEPLNSHLGQDGQLASVRFINFVVDKYSDNGYCVAIRDTSSTLYDN